MILFLDLNLIPRNVQLHIILGTCRSIFLYPQDLINYTDLLLFSKTTLNN